MSLPRSEIIQNLSIFVGALEWVHPTEGNYTICESGTNSNEKLDVKRLSSLQVLGLRMRKVIKRILDQVLDMPPPNPSNPETNAFNDTAQPRVDISSILDPQDEPDFLEWLNSVDWTRDMLQDAWK